MLDLTNNTPGIIDFDEPEKDKSIIKVIGVGGGGGNADTVDNMHIVVGSTGTDSNTLYFV